MTQAPYMQQAPQQGQYPPQGPQQGYQPQPQNYQQAPQQGQYAPQGQPQTPYQQPQQNGGYQPQGYPSQQQGQYQPVAQAGPVQGNPQQEQGSALPDQHDPDSGNDPMLEDVQVFRTGGVAPFMTWSDPACTGYRRGGTILAVGTDTAKVFGTQEPAFWTWGNKKGQPIMCKHLIVQTDERIPGKPDDTGIRTIELKDGTTRFQAAALAVRTSSPNDLNFRPGAQIYFTRTGERRNKSNTTSTLYQCEYIPAPADYVANDTQLMSQNMGDQGHAQAPSQGAQQLQQAAAYVASTPNAPAQNGQPVYQAAPQGTQPQYQAAPQQAPAQGQGQQAPWMQQGPAQPQQQSQAPWMAQQPQGQPQAAPWQQQGPAQAASQQGQQAPPPWQAQGQPQQAQVQGHPFGSSTQQPMPSPYPQGQQG